MRVTLEHKRVHELYQGKVYRGDTVVFDFGGLSFADMILDLSKILKDEDEVWMKRTDREGLHPVALSKAEVALLREHPEDYINSFSLPPIRVITRDEVRPRDVLRVRVRAGHDTLADAFGDEVYCRYKDNKVESPFTGRWRPPDVVQTPEGTRRALLQVHLGDPELVKRQVEGGPQLRLVPEGEPQWAAIKTEALLKFAQVFGADRYYLPRAWNQPGPWISHADLQKKYDEYLKEKEDVSTTG